MAEHVEEDDAWSVTSTRMLIEFYKKNRQLWDKNHKDNSNKSKTNKVLSPLVAKFEKSSPPRSLNDIKKRWHGIKSCFQRYMKKSPAEQENIKWTYWSDLSFLRESLNAEETESEIQWSNQDIEILIAFFQENECLWNHSNAEYHQNSNKDLLYDLLGKELEDKYDVEDIKKKWKEVLKRFKQEYSKASVKPSGAGTAEIYTPSWEFYEQLKYVTVICDDTDDTVSSVSEPSKPKVKKASKQQQKDSREDRKLELFSEAVVAMRQPEMPQGQTNSVENSEVAAFANYVRLTLSKLNPRKFRRAKKCIGDILFQIEESDEMEVAIGAATRFSTHGRYSPAPSISSYSSSEANQIYQQNIPAPHESMQQMHSFAPMEYY